MRGGAHQPLSAAVLHRRARGTARDMSATAKALPRLELFYGGSYFKGDSIRQCLVYAGLPFDDVRSADAGWKEFTELRASGALPFGQMPVLRVGGVGGAVLGQSTALCRLVGRLAAPELELYPRDPVVAARVDAILSQDDDMRTGFYCMNYQERYGFSTALGGAESEQREAVRTEILASVLPRHLGFFEHMLAQSPTGWLAGTALPTVADFYMAGSFSFLGAGLGEPRLLESYPNIQALIARVHQLPAIAAWDQAEKARL